MRRLSTLAAAAATVLFASPSFAGDWANWRGPEMNGVSRETNLPETWDLETRENVVWDSEIGGRSAPVILNGKVYLNCRTEHDITNPKTAVDAQEQVVCWDLETGEILWKDVFNVFQTDIPAPRIGWGSMAADPETGNVYVHSVSGLFICYSADGERLWERSFFEEDGKISGYGGRNQTPIIDEDRVIISFLSKNWGETGAPPPKHRYYAFDKKTGEMMWVAAPGGPPQDTNYSVPIVTVIDGERLLIGGNGDGGFYAINARTGKTRWSQKMSKRATNVSPVVEENRVYIAHGEDNIDTIEFGRIQCIDGSAKGPIGPEQTLWRVDGIKMGYASLAIHDGILYCTADTGMLYAFDSKTGDRLWEFNLGTVGKGSPVWADDKLYVMEVNGNIHILKPSREGCESLSHVTLEAREGAGTDEIYASPAVSNGKVIFVTRDRTICIAEKGAEPATGEIPAMAEEKPVEEAIATVHVIPAEIALSAGEGHPYRLQTFDANGGFIEETTNFAFSGSEGLDGVKVEGTQVAVPEDLSAHLGGTVKVEYEGVTATARVRAFPKLPWKWTFDELTGKQVPVTWINAIAAIGPLTKDGETYMQKTSGEGRPSAYIWCGPPEMTGYTVQCDVMSPEERRQMANIGVTCQRYNLTLKGNVQKLEVLSWVPHKRAGKEVSFRWDPDKWYTMKLRVTPVDGGCNVQGKVWERGKPEPEKWSIEAFDPHPNEIGSPGIYFYAQTACFFDNYQVYPSDSAPAPAEGEAAAAAASE